MNPQPASTSTLTGTLWPIRVYDLREDSEDCHNLISEARPKGPQRAEAADGQWFNRYVIPEFDGIRQPVNGRGQLDRVVLCLGRPDLDPISS